MAQCRMPANRGPKPSARSVNPEAGDYPIADDPLEWAAAEAAARRSWQECPYYERRYGARGWRFTLSDSGWIATLCALPPPLAQQRIRWLRELLMTRGMPSVLLERHLEFLHAELIGRAPERAPGYSVIAAGVVWLRRERLQLLPESQLEHEASRFDAAARDMPGSIPLMGTVLVGAVLDELLGLSPGERSAITWALQRERFTAPWIDAVDRTVASVRQAAGGGLGH